MPTPTRTTQPVDEAWLEQVQTLLREIAGSARYVEVSGGRLRACDRCGHQQSNPEDGFYEPTCVVRQAIGLLMVLVTTRPDTTIQQQVVEAIRERYKAPDATTVTPALVVTLPSGRTHVVLPHGTSFVFYPDEIQTKPPGHWI